jgi:hypothetical protein
MDNAASLSLRLPAMAYALAQLILWALLSKLRAYPREQFAIVERQREHIVGAQIQAADSFGGPAGR